jgi:REP-associated tyrosine transposase
MSYVRVWIHAVWGTKNRTPFLVTETRRRTIDHIKENARTKGIYVDRVNGHHDHLHCLFGLNADISISKTLQLIKGESVYWINKEHLTRLKFGWADEYYAASVSEWDLPRVRKYIDDQEEHHREQSFTQEVEELLKSYKSTQAGNPTR